MGTINEYIKNIDKLYYETETYANSAKNLSSNSIDALQSFLEENAYCIEKYNLTKKISELISNGHLDIESYENLIEQEERDFDEREEAERRRRREEAERKEEEEKKKKELIVKITKWTLIAVGIILVGLLIINVILPFIFDYWYLFAIIGAIIGYIYYKNHHD